MFKKRVITAVVIFITAVLSLFAQPKEPVAVLDFVGNGVSQSDAAAISSLFTAELVRSGAFEVMDRKNIDEILTEHKLQLSGCTDTSCAVEIGQILSLQYIFSGEVSKLGNAYLASINYINVETSKIERSSTQKFNEISEIYDVLPAAIAELTGDADYSPPSNLPQQTKWWDSLSESQQTGFITMLSGTAAAVIGGGLLAVTNAYYTAEVLPLYQIYQDTGGGFDSYAEKAGVKNTMLISSVGLMGTGVIAAAVGIVMWFTEPSEKHSPDELSFDLKTDTSSAVSLNFNIKTRGVRK